MNTIVVQGITVDFSQVTSDGWTWVGKIIVSCATLTATANLHDAGFGIVIVDIEGEDERFCDHIDSLEEPIIEALSSALGDPRGRSARRQAREDRGGLGD